VNRHADCRAIAGSTVIFDSIWMSEPSCAASRFHHLDRRLAEIVGGHMPGHVDRNRGTRP
jgi:hypothetical protein